MKTRLFEGINFQVYLETEKKKEAEKIIIENGGMILSEHSIVVTSDEYIKTFPKDLYYKELKHNFLKPTWFSVEFLKTVVEKNQKFPLYSVMNSGVSKNDALKMNWEKIDDFFDYNNWKEKYKFLEQQPKKTLSKENCQFFFGSDVDSVIVSFLSLPDVLNLKFINKKTKDFIQKDFIWKNLCENFFLNNSSIMKNKNFDVKPKSWYLYFRQKIYPLMLQLNEFKNPTQFSTGIKISRKRALKELKIGASKIGGSPDLPKNMEIPENSLLALQLNLEEVSRDNFLCWNLPKTGMLYFFITLPGFETGFQEFGKVMYYSGDVSNLKRVANPTIGYANDEEYEEILSFPMVDYLLFESEIKLFESVVVQTKENHIEFKEGHLMMNWDEGQMKPEFPFVMGDLKECKDFSNQKLFQIMQPFSSCGCDYFFFQFILPTELLDDLENESTWEKCQVGGKLYSV
eukprot:gene5528-9345_t